MNSSAVASSLQASLESAIGSCSAAVHSLALLEVTHWETEQGISAVSRVRQQLASVRTEMAAGRCAPVLQEET